MNISSCGICGTDMDMLNNKGHFSHIAGHEMSGRLTDGTLVAIEPLEYCGGCSDCKSGNYNLCSNEKFQMIGLTSNGGMAEQIIVPEHCLAEHNIAKKQMRLYGGMVTFVVSGGLSQAKKVLENLEVFTLAESLGGAESLAEHPAIMTHASIPKETREALGIDDGLIRLSVGIETAEDLINDLKNALG